MTACRCIVGVLAAGWIALGPAMAAARAADEAAVEFYEKRIRPILASNCYECHGDDQQESGLSVTSVAAMLRGGDQGPAIVPGDADASLLIQGVRYEDSNFQMPPKAKLSTDQIATLEQWIADGALGPEESQTGAAPKKFDLAERAKHWCFQPVGDPTPPEVGDAAWPRDPLDRFILAKLDAAGLQPAAEADPRTLVRRAYFDLVGLPPSVDEVEALVAGDESYEAVVDRLLASPHFGERWARHWLDLVRYAETRGHEFDMVIPNAYQYRDYVIRALNADVPYDQFVREHLAGDLLPTPRMNDETGANESILGTGFWWLGEEVHSPVDIRQDETDRVDNKLDVFSKTFLGLTVACARCHDHKFDAITTKDYYALSGFVLSMSYRQAAFEAEAHNRRIYDEVKRLEAEFRPKLIAAQYALWKPVVDKADDYLAAVREVSQELRREGKRAHRDAVVTAVANQFGIDDQRLAAWVATAEAEPEGPLGPRGAELFKPEWSPPTAPPDGWRIVYDAAAVPAGQWFSDGLPFGDGPRLRGELRIGGDPNRPIDRVVTAAAAAVEPKWDVVRPAADVEEEQNRINWQQSGRTLKTPTFTLQNGRLAYLVRGSCRVYAEVASHRTNRGPLQGEFVKQVAGNDAWRWVEHDLSGFCGERVHLEFTPLTSSELKDKQSAEFAVRGVIERPDTPNPLQAWYFDPPPTAADFAKLAPSGDLDDVFRSAAEALRQARDGRRLDVAATFVVDWMLAHPELWNTPAAEIAAAVEPFFKRQAELVAQLKRTSHTAPCAWEGSGVDEHVLVRGQHKSPGELVGRRSLEVLDGPAAPQYKTASGRLELAERLVDGGNPLVARVIVNRVWHHLLGRGIVRSVDNFGSMGDAPTHPELLDHLAREFMDDGWSVKRLIRRIMLSTTYRQASDHLAAGLDPARDATPARGRAPRLNADDVDPKNNLFHRVNVRRLDAEVIRDALLAVSGRLDTTMYGPSVEAHLTDFMEGRGRPKASGPLDGDGRRSIYLRVRRNFLNPMFQAFDYPTPFTTIGRRASSNVPAQALSLLNGELVNELARHWAERTLRDGPSDADARIERLYREAFARPPTDDERIAARDFLREQQAAHGATDADDPHAWTDLCHVLFNVKEFIYIP